METQLQGVKGACKQFNLDNTLIGAHCQVMVYIQMQPVKHIKLPRLDNPTQSLTNWRAHLSCLPVTLHFL